MYQEIVNVDISLQTAGVNTASFGIPMFISDHVWFKERSRTYVDLASAAIDLPTDSDAYVALQQAFGVSPAPAQVKVGRREVDTITFTPDAVTAVGQIFELTVIDTAGTTFTASFTTSTGSETAANITAALDTALSGAVGITVTDNTGTLDLAKSGTDPFAVTLVSKLSYSTVTTETAAEVMAAITLENDDFYFVACNDHTDTFIQAMATDIEARTKVYFVSVQDVANLGAYSEVATDTLSKLRQGSYFRTSAWYHDTADTTFPEMEYITVASTADTGKKVWANNRVSGSAAKDVSTGYPLSATQKGNLVDKYSNFTETVGGLVITRKGMVSAKEYIDVIRNRDFLEARITEAYQNFLINSPVVPYTDTGITQIKNVLSTVLNRYVETESQPNILQKNNPFVINFPKRVNIPFADVSNRVFDNGTFTAYLSGAIQVVKITGTLTYEGV